MATQTYVALATTTLSGTTASVTFSSIPADYRDLVLVTKIGNNGSGAKEISLVFNSDSSNRSRVFAAGYSGGTLSGTASTILAAYNTAGLISSNTAHIMDYSATDKHKTVLVRNGDTAFTMMQAGRWASTAAINSIELSISGASFTAGSTFSLYGIEA